jgi:nicotinate-nucleotide adenylyltransferase
MNKVGIMGGTFNPIHNGHLFLAEQAYEQLGLDKCLFMPSKNPPHKKEQEITSSEHRLNMVRLAIRDNPHFEASTIELDREGMTYTADTLKLLTSKHPNTEYYFIVGADSLLQMPQWKDPQTVFRLSTIAAAGRNHLSEDILNQQIRGLKEEYDARIILLQMPDLEISSADIRDRIADGKSVRYYLPEQVTVYIKCHGLFGCPVE